jgi:hypothetical protein
VTELARNGTLTTTGNGSAIRLSMPLAPTLQIGISGNGRYLAGDREFEE